MTVDTVAEYLERGVALHRQGKFAQAESLYRKVLSLAPDNARACHNLALLLLDGGEPEAALPGLEKAVQVEPACAAFWNTLGRARLRLSQPLEAKACFTQALALDAGDINARINLGNTQLALGNTDAAAECYQAVLQREPGALEAIVGMGGVCQEDGRFPESIDHYRRALQSYTGSGDIHSNLALSLLHTLSFSECVETVRAALALGLRDGNSLTNIIFTLHHLRWDRAGSLAVIRSFQRLCPSQVSTSVPDPDPDRVIRVGYVSGDFGTHAVAHWIAPLLAHHDSRSVQVFCYETRPRRDSVNRILRSFGWQWRSLDGLSDADAERRIRDDGIDILVDLAGHTRGHRLPIFARRPSPIQITWFGDRVSTGLEAMDYIVATRRLLPPDEAPACSEQPLYLPEAYACFDPLTNPSVSVGPLPALTNGYVTFGVLHQLRRLHPDSVRCWARILRACPDSRILFKASGLERSEIRATIIARFADHGIDADRLILEGAAPQREFFDTFNRVDIALDPFPYRGGVVTHQTLWMGVPVVTLEEPAGLIGHYGAAILAPLDLHDWISTDEDDYVARACRHAGNVANLVLLRKDLRARLRASPMGNGALFVPQWETALRMAWRDLCAREHA